MAHQRGHVQPNPITGYTPTTNRTSSSGTNNSQSRSVQPQPNTYNNTMSFGQNNNQNNGKQHQHHVRQQQANKGQASFNTQLREAIVNVYDNRHHDQIYVDRQNLKKKIQGPNNFLVGNVISNDEKYKNQMGTISRSYRGSGFFTGSDFDMHVPLNAPENAKIVFDEMRLPGVTVSMSNVRAGAWSDVVANGGLSSEKLKQQLRAKMANEVKEWNSINAQYGTFSLADMKINQPLHLEFKFPDQDKPVVISVNPVLFARELDNFQALHTKIVSDTKTWKWPADIDFRNHLAAQILLIPRGGGWIMANMIAHKILIGNFDDDGVTFREPLYRALKSVNKKIMNGSSDHEGVKVGSYTLLQVFLSHLANHQDLNEWNTEEKLGERWKQLVSEWRNVLSQGECHEYAMLGKANALASYKNGSFLNPTLAGLVRKLESVQKDPINMLNKCADVLKKYSGTPAQGQVSKLSY